MAEIVIIKKLSSLAAGSVSGLKRLKQLWGPVRRILAFSPADNAVAPQRQLSVAIEKGQLSVALVSRFLSRIAIKGMREYPFEQDRYPQPKDLAASLALAANEFGGAGTQVTLTIPKAWAVIRSSEFPATIRENIPAVVAYEMDRLTPFSAEDAVFDYAVLNESGQKMTLLVAAARREIIDPYVEALKENGFHVNGVTVGLSGIGTLIHHLGAAADTVFVDIDESGYEGALFINGVLSHSFSGSLQAEDDQSGSAKMAAEVNGLLQAARANGRSPQVVALTRSSSQRVVESLKMKIDSPVRMLNAMDAALKSSSSRGNIPYAAVGGALEFLLPKTRGLNLLSRGLRTREKTPVALTVLLALGISVAVLLYLTAPLRVERNRLSRIESEIPAKKAEARKVEALRAEADALSAEIAAISDFKESKPTALSLVKELTTVLPNSAWLSRLRINGPTVEIEGFATASTELLPKLEASKHFRKVEFASPTFRDNRMNADRFSIRMEIEDIPEAKPEAATAKKTEKEKGRHEKK